MCSLYDCKKVLKKRSQKEFSVTGLKKFFNSSVGCKATMALTGLALVGFLIAHLAGNLLVFKGPEAINLYAKTLRDFPVILWALRLGLLASFLLHIYAAIRLTALSKGSVGYKVKHYRKSRFVARSMALTGSTVLFFVLYHLAHLTFRLTHPEFQKLGHYDVYEMLIQSFTSPLLSSFYVLSIICLMAHLVHGLQSFWRTLGLRHHKYNDLFNRSSLALGIILALSFISIPVSILLGIIR